MPDINVSSDRSIRSGTITRKKRVLNIRSFVPKYFKQIFVLLIITPILTELLTNNIPVSQFFQPKLFFTLAILVYGPILLLRELAIRWNVRLTGYILLGLVYGIYNEGLFAKTFFKLKIANTAFDNYGFVWGINLPWSAVITIFHAFYAFLFPILIVYNIFPKVASTPWMSKKWWIGISIVSFLYISYKFLKNTWPVSPLHYVVLIAIMAGLILLSRFFKGGLIIVGKKPRLWLLICYGIVFVATTFTVADIIARSGINFLFFLAYAVINLLTAVMLLNKKYGIRTLLIFALSAQLGFAASIILVAAVTKSEIGIITGSVFAVIFTLAIIMMIIRSKANLANQNQLTE
jgi:hypothetical protein